MEITDHSFHDSTLLRVTEFPSEQVIEFLIDFPVDWDNNLFEHRILQFNDVMAYTIDEIPFGDNPTILELHDLGSVTTKFGSGRSSIEVTRNLVSIITNAGKRTIQYSSVELKLPN